MDSIKKHNKGFSLIELMIAMLVTSLIIASLFYSVIGDLKAYETTRATENLVAKSRMSVQTLRLYIQQAGFRDVTELKNNVVFSPETSIAGWVWAEGQALQGTKNNALIADAKADSDIIVMRFSGAIQTGIVSCDGTNLLNNNTNEITLYVNDNDQLMCRDNADAALLLDDGVEFLELLYGTTDNTTRYFTEATVTDWDSVNRIKVGLLLSQEVSANNLTNSNSYTIFNKTVSAANDTNYRAVVVETVVLRNQGG